MDVLRQQHAPIRGHRPGNADDRAVDALAGEARGLHQRGGQVGHAVQHLARLRAWQLDVLACTDAAGEVADGAAQEAGAEVEAEHQRGLGHRLEEHGAVGRPVAGGIRLAHEPGVEQRRQRRGRRRLRDPRAAADLGARDRCARADRVEHGTLVQMLQEGLSRHLRRNSNGIKHLTSANAQE